MTREGNRGQFIGWRVLLTCAALAQVFVVVQDLRGQPATLPLAELSRSGHVGLNAGLGYDCTGAPPISVKAQVAVARGVTLLNCQFVLEDGATWTGGSMTSTGAMKGFFVSAKGTDVRLEDLAISTRDAQGLTGAIQLYQTTNAVVRSIRVEAGTGPACLWIEGSSHVTVSDLSCRTSGSGDDGIVIKAVTKPTTDVSISNCTVEGFFDIVGIGTEVAKSVSNVSINNCHGTRVGTGLYIKPGVLHNRFAISQGNVSHVRVDDMSISDPCGLAYREAFLISAGNDSTVEDVEIKNLRSFAAAASDAAAYQGEVQAFDNATIRRITLSDFVLSDATTMKEPRNCNTGKALWGIRVHQFGPKSVITDVLIRNGRIEGALGPAVEARLASNVRVEQLYAANHLRKLTGAYAVELGSGSICSLVLGSSTANVSSIGKRTVSIKAATGRMSEECKGE